LRYEFGSRFALWPFSFRQLMVARGAGEKNCSRIIILVPKQPAQRQDRLTGIRFEAELDPSGRRGPEAKSAPGHRLASGHRRAL